MRFQRRRVLVNGTGLLPTDDGTQTSNPRPLILDLEAWNGRGNPGTFVAWDAHRKTGVATALVPKGSVVDRTTLTSKPDDLRAYLRRLPGRKHVLLEACTMWEHVYDTAQKEAESVVLAHPYRTRIIAEASIKTGPWGWASGIPFRRDGRGTRDVCEIRRRTCVGGRFADRFTRNRSS